MSFSLWYTPVPSYENEEQLAADIATMLRRCCSAKRPPFADAVVEEIDNQYGIDLRAMSRGQPDAGQGEFDEFVNNLATELADICFNLAPDCELTAIHDRWVLVTGADDSQGWYPECTKYLSILAVIDDVRAISEPAVASSVLTEENMRAYIEHHRLEVAVEAFVERKRKQEAARKG